jgi:hypothetical protein
MRHTCAAWGSWSMHQLVILGPKKIWVDKVGERGRPHCTGFPTHRPHPVSWTKCTLARDRLLAKEGVAMHRPSCLSSPFVSSGCEVARGVVITVSIQRGRGSEDLRCHRTRPARCPGGRTRTQAGSSCGGKKEGCSTLSLSHIHTRTHTLCRCFIATNPPTHTPRGCLTAEHIGAPLTPSQLALVL